MIVRRGIAAIIATVCLLAAGHATTDRIKFLDNVLEVDILHGWREPSGNHMAGLAIRLGKDWKTYWRNPGESGIPPLFDWQESTNLAHVTVHWPAPEIFNLQGFTTIGYEDRFVIPIELVPQDKDSDIHVNASLDFGVCRDVCVPVRKQVSKSLSMKFRSNVETIAHALDKGPISFRDAGFLYHDCEFRFTADKFEVVATVEAPRVLKKAVAAVFELPDAEFWFYPPTVSLSGPRLEIRSEIVPFGDERFLIERSRLLMTLLTDGKAIEFSGC